MVGHAIQSIKGINEKIYSKKKQKQKPIHYITNINSNEMIYSKKKSNRLYFFKKLEKKFKKRSKVKIFKNTK